MTHPQEHPQRAFELSLRGLSLLTSALLQKLSFELVLSESSYVLQRFGTEFHIATGYEPRLQAMEKESDAALLWVTAHYF